MQQQKCGWWCWRDTVTVCEDVLDRYTQTGTTVAVRAATAVVLQGGGQEGDSLVHQPGRQLAGHLLAGEAMLLCSCGQLAQDRCIPALQATVLQGLSQLLFHVGCRGRGTSPTALLV